MENNQRQVMPSEAFAGLGGGRIAYIRAMKSDEAKGLFPQLPPVAPGLDLWALLGRTASGLSEGGERPERGSAGTGGA